MNAFTGIHGRLVVYVERTYISFTGHEKFMNFQAILHRDECNCQWDCKL